MNNKKIQTSIMIGLTTVGLTSQSGQNTNEKVSYTEVKSEVNELTIEAISILEQQNYLDKDSVTGEIIIRKSLINRLRKAGVLDTETVGASSDCTRGECSTPKN